MTKIKVDKIKVGDTICTPGDRKVRWVCGKVSKVEREDGLVILSSPDWATESSRKYGSGVGVYTARSGETLRLKDAPTRGRR